MEIPIPIAGLVPCMHVVIPGGPQPWEPWELTHGAFVMPAKTRTLLFTGASAVNVGESV